MARFLFPLDLPSYGSDGPNSPEPASARTLCVSQGGVCNCADRVVRPASGAGPMPASLWHRYSAVFFTATLRHRPARVFRRAPIHCGAGLQTPQTSAGMAQIRSREPKTRSPRTLCRWEALRFMPIQSLLPLQAKESELDLLKGAVQQIKTHWAILSRLFANISAPRKPIPANPISSTGAPNFCFTAPSSRPSKSSPRAIACSRNPRGCWWGWELPGMPAALTSTLPSVFAKPQT